MYSTTETREKCEKTRCTKKIVWKNKFYYMCVKSKHEARGVN